jgi:S1-C subfamily serine protease
MTNRVINKSNLIIFCFLLVATLAFSQEKTAVQIKNEYGKAVVMIATYKEEKKMVGLGSGFIVSENGVITTNYHVIDGAYPAAVKLLNGDIYEDISVIDYDVQKDIAIIKIKGWNLPKVSLGNSDNVEVGEKVYVIGNPEGLENSVSDGLLSGIRETGKGYKLHQISAPISPGSSGSPVFNSQGKVIGVAASSIVEGQNLNFSIPINYVRGMISDNPKMTLEEFARTSSQRKEPFAEVVGKLSVKECLRNLANLTLKFWTAVDILDDAGRETTEPHKTKFQPAKWVIHPGIYTSNEIFKDIHSKLGKISCSDDKCEEIRNDYLVEIERVVEGMDILLDGFVVRNGYPDWNEVKKGMAKIGIGRENIINEKVKLISLINENCPELKDSLPPFYFVTKVQQVEPLPYVGFWYKFAIRKIEVSRVITKSPGEKSGLLKGDIILGIKNGPKFPTIVEFKDFLNKQKVGNSIELLILRNGTELVLKVKLEASP